MSAKYIYTCKTQSNTKVYNLLKLQNMYSINTPHTLAGINIGKLN